MIPLWILPTQIPSALSPGVHVVLRRGIEPAITVKKNGGTLDLTGFDLRGSQTGDQEKYTGVGILFDHCKNLTIKNGSVRGYRINILLRGCSNVRLEGIKSNRSHAEPILTRLGVPKEKFLNLRNVDEWTTYGAGFWLHDCTDCHLVRCSAHHAMNGTVLVSSNDCTIYNCDFSYNSGWGLALWASAGNRLLWNHIDFCNRPWSGGWGGDAANLVLVTNSNKNLVVGNSLTHGGDGFFLADRVEGGWDEKSKKFQFADSSDENIIWANDGSWASANAFEATFSHDNQFGENLADNSEYGFWLGYSSTSWLIANHIDRNEHDGVAIEHGSKNRIQANQLDSDGEAGVHLWSTPGDKDKDRPSVDNSVTDNRIENCGVPLDLKGSVNTKSDENGSDATPTESGSNWTTPPAVVEALKLKPKRWKSYRDSGGPTGQAWLQAGEYTPIAFLNYGSASVGPTSYKLWFADKPQDLKAPNWIKLDSGSNPHYMTATMVPDKQEAGTDRIANLTFELPSREPQPIPGLVPTVSQQMSLSFRTGQWDCKWFAWKDLGYDDRKSWLYLFSSPPVAEQYSPGLIADDNSRSQISKQAPKDHFALLATRRFNFGEGIYRFTTLSDDGMRLFVDGREVISRWNRHSAAADSVEISLTKGTHDLRVEYCHTLGTPELKVDWTAIARVIRIRH